MSKPCHIFSQNKNETSIFTISKPNMKKSKYQNTVPHDLKKLSNDWEEHNSYIEMLYLK